MGSHGESSNGTARPPSSSEDDDSDTASESPPRRSSSSRRHGSHIDFSSRPNPIDSPTGSHGESSSAKGTARSPLSLVDDDGGAALESPPRRRSSSRRHSSHRSRRSRTDRAASGEEGSQSSGRSRTDRAVQTASEADGSASSAPRAAREVTNEEIVEYALKKTRKVAMKLKAKTVLGYSNDCNPWGDPNLMDMFVWRKKIERDVARGVPVDISYKAEKKKHRERMAEIKKLQKRREERCTGKAQNEDEMASLAREARAEFQVSEKKEEGIHFDQSKVRSQIRLREGHMKPIDVLSMNLNITDDFDTDINEPYLVFKSLTLKEMEEFHEDIRMHLELDNVTQTHIDFWTALMVICEWELAEARKRGALDRGRVCGEEPPAEVLAEERGLHSSIEVDVKNLLEGKTSSQLESMQQQIDSQIPPANHLEKVAEYMEAKLKIIHIYKAKPSCLKDIHASLLRTHLHLLEKPAETKEHAESENDIKSKEEDVVHFVKDPQDYSPKPKIIELRHETEEPCLFAPELPLGDEEEEVIDPKEDSAELVEGTFMDGTKLITIHDAVASENGNLEMALHGSFLPGKDTA